MQGTQVQSLIREDPRCLRATKAVCYSYSTRALEPGNHNYWGQVLQLLKPVFSRAWARQQEKPLRWEACTPQPESSPPLPPSLQLKKACLQEQTPSTAAPPPQKRTVFKSCLKWHLFVYLINLISFDYQVRLFAFCSWLGVFFSLLFNIVNVYVA